MDKRDIQLGMNQGTASRHLRNAMLLMLAQKCGMDHCFRCGLKIESVKELSLDHKQDWLNVDVALYWDLNNIAFSHLKCNTVHQRTNRALHAPVGKAWCSIHREYLPVERFYRNRRNASGYGTCCSECFEKQRTL